MRVWTRWSVIWITRQAGKFLSDHDRPPRKPVREPRTGLCFQLCSNFVEVIQHFAARPQHYNTQRDDQKGGHFLSSSWQRRASYAAASRSMSSA